MDPFSVTSLGSGLSQIAAQAWSLIGPAPAGGWKKTRAQFVSDLAVQRNVEYYSNLLTVDRSRIGGVRYENLIADPSELLSQFNKMAWGPDGAPRPQSWAWLQDRLKRHAIDLAIPGEAGTQPIAQDWLRSVIMSSAPAPLADFIRDWHRSGHIEDPAARERLDFAMRRVGMSNPADRQLLMQPWAHWSIAEITRLRWLGIIGDDEYIRLLNSAGVSKADDGDYAQHLNRVMPPAGVLLAWQARRMWDEEIVKRFGLDNGANDLNVANFFARVQGLGAPAPRLPGQPEGVANFRRLEHRASWTLPNIGQAIEMQWRLRASAADPENSVRAGVATWTPDDTRSMLRVSGYPDSVVEQLMGLTVAPLSPRVISRILVPSLRNPDVARLADTAFGVGNDWVRDSFLDQGYAPAAAAAISAGVRDQADQTVNAEKYAHEKQYRQSRREVAVKEYRAGTLTREDAVPIMTDAWYNDLMAIADLDLVEREIRLGIIERQIKAIRETFLRGAITAESAYKALVDLRVVMWRANLYLLEWQWERTESVRTLSTGEVLSLLRQGLISEPVALARLSNLGWNTPDALLEIASVERTLALARAKELGAQAAKTAHQQQAEVKTHKAELEKAHKEMLATEKEHKRIAKADALALHEKLLASSKYYEAVHRSNAAYQAAEKKGNAEKMAAEVESQVGDYHRWLIDQTKLLYGGTSLGEPVTTIDSKPASSVAASAVATAGLAGVSETGSEPAK